MELSSSTDRNQEISESDRIRNYKLLLGFKRSAEFLESSDLAALLSLNHFFNSHLQTPEFLIHLTFNFLSFVTIKPVNYENIFKVFEDFSGIRFFNILQITSCLRKTKNLIKNPCGALGFYHWRVSRKGCDWRVDDSKVYKSMRTVFVNSFNWGSLTQNINLAGLIKEGRSYALVAGCPVSGRENSRYLASLHIKVFSKNGDEREATSMADLSINNGADPWRIPRDKELLSIDDKTHGLHFDHWMILKSKIWISIDDESAEISFDGKDLYWWGQSSGARFGYCYAFSIYLINT